MPNVTVQMTALVPALAGTGLLVTGVHSTRPSQAPRPDTPGRAAGIPAPRTVFSPGISSNDFAPPAQPPNHTGQGPPGGSHERR